MAEFQFVCFAAECEAENLIAEADAEDRRLADQLAYVRNLIDAAGSGSARPVRKKYAIRLERENVFGRGERGHDSHFATGVYEAAKNVLLDPEIVSDDVMFRFGIFAREIGRRALADTFVPFITFRSGNSRGEIEAGHRWNRARFFDQLVRVFFDRGEDPAHHTAAAQVANKRARIEIGDNGNIGFREELLRFSIRTPVAGDVRKLANDETFDVRVDSFVIGRSRAVIANLRVKVRTTIWPGVRRRDL